MWKQIAILACVLCLFTSLVSCDPLSDLHALAGSAPKLTDLERLDARVEMNHATTSAAQHTAMQAEATHPLDTSFIASESVVSHFAGQDSDLKQLGSLSTALSQKKHAVELQRAAIDADEGKLQRLRRIIAENKEILVRNEQALASSSSTYLGAVKQYTAKVNAAVVQSLQATQDAARAQVQSIVAGQPRDAAIPAVVIPKLDAEDDRAVQLVGGGDRSMLAVDATAAVRAAQMAEAHLSAEHAAQFARLVAQKATAINQEYARDLAAHKASIPKTHQNDFAAFATNLKLDRESDLKRNDALRAAMHVKHAAPVAAPTRVHHESAQPFDQTQVAKVRAEMAGEPVTMFLETEEVIARKPIPGTPVKPGLVKPKIEKGIIGLPEAPVPTKPNATVPDCGKDAILDRPKRTKLNKRKYNKGKKNKGKKPTTTTPTTTTTTTTDDSQPDPSFVPDSPPVSLLEVDADGEVEAEVVSTMDVDSMTDADADADVAAEAEAEAETESEVDSEAEADAEYSEEAFVEIYEDEDY